MKMREIMDVVQQGSEMFVEEEPEKGLPKSMKKQINLKDLRRLIGAGRRRHGFFDLYTVNGYKPNVTPIFYDGKQVRTVLIQMWHNTNLLWNVMFFDDGMRELAKFADEPFEIDAEPPTA